MDRLVDEHSVLADEPDQLFVKNFEQNWGWILSLFVRFDCMLEIALQYRLAGAIRQQVLSGQHRSGGEHWEMLDHCVDDFERTYLVLLGRRHLNDSVFLELGEKEVRVLRRLKSAPFDFFLDLADVLVLEDRLLLFQDLSDQQ